MRSQLYLFSIHLVKQLTRSLGRSHNSITTDEKYRAALPFFVQQDWFAALQKIQIDNFENNNDAKMM